MKLEVYEIDQQRSRKLSVVVPNDGVAMRPSRVSATNLIEDFELSPKGERALFVARGDIFTAPIENGPTRNLTRSSAAHDKWARWSPDGSRIAFVSDATGEEEIYVVPQDGAGVPTQLTEGGQAMRYAPVWSSDGESLAFSNKDGELYVLDIESKTLTDVADEARGQVRDYTWSPNGGYLAFSLTEPNDFSSIFIWRAADKTLHRVTGEYFHEWNPAWDPEGDYLYYLSDRQFSPQLGSFEWNYLVDRETGIYALALRGDVIHPLPPESDEVILNDDGDEDRASADTEPVQGSEAGAAIESTGSPISIEFDGLARRVVRLPVEFDNYEGLSAGPGRVFYIRGTAQYYGRRSDLRPELHGYTFEDRTSNTIAEGVSGYAISNDGQQLLVREGDNFKVYPASGGEAKPVSTLGLMVDRVPAQEWAQIFDEVWRRFRDFFYVDNMHGYDWEALRGRYRPLLAHVATPVRSQLRDR